jgi:hypothetical protein
MAQHDLVIAGQNLDLNSHNLTKISTLNSASCFSSGVPLKILVQMF